MPLIRSRKHRWNRLYLSTVNLELRPLLQFTRYLRSGRREREAPARDRLLSRASRPDRQPGRTLCLPRQGRQLYAYYAITVRRNNKGPGIAEAFDAGLQESFIAPARWRPCRTSR